MKTGARVFLGIPFYQLINGQAADAYDNGVARDSQNQYVKAFAADSFLARNFNHLWTEALNTRKRGWTHFCMIHADVSPHTPCWIDVLVEEMKQVGADLLHVILPIKSHHGLTSTAVYHKPTGNVRRLTMREVHAIQAPTFDAAGAGFPGGEHLLMASTGLWICDFTKPWVEQVWFEVRDRILKHDGGEFYYETRPEDWHFSLLLHKLGLKVYGTKKIVTGHWGQVEFRNDAPWGTVAVDPHVGSFSWIEPPEPLQGLEKKELFFDLNGPCRF